MSRSFEATCKMQLSFYIFIKERIEKEDSGRYLLEAVIPDELRPRGHVCHAADVKVLEGVKERHRLPPNVLESYYRYVKKIEG